MFYFDTSFVAPLTLRRTDQQRGRGILGLRNSLEEPVTGFGYIELFAW